LVKAKSEPGLWLEDVPVPDVGPNDVLVRVGHTSICGTDLHIWDWDEWARTTIPVPMTVGHEFMGVIEEVGSHVVGVEPGQRVSGEGHLTCGYCRNCRAGIRHLCRNTVGVGVNRPGCFADYLSIPASNVFVLPESIPDDWASFLDPFGNAVHAALSFNLVGEDVLITGAGPIGCMAAAICRHVGARYVVVTDLNDYRLQIAGAMGATRTVNVLNQDVQAVMDELGMKEGFDIGLEMSGSHAAIRTMFAVMNHGGRVAILGIPSGPGQLDWNDVIFKGLTIKGIYGREMFETWYKMANLLQSGLDLSPVLTHTFPAEGFAEAFGLIKTAESGKVVLDWTV
jgi:threonine 3-dehydrogenase